MIFLVPAYRDTELSSDRPDPWEVVIPDIPMGGPHNRFIALESGRKCMHARADIRKFDLTALNMMADKFCSMFPGLPKNLVEHLIVSSMGLPDSVAKYKGMYRVLVTDTDATLIGVDDDSVVHQLWSGFDPARYMNG